MALGVVVEPVPQGIASQRLQLGVNGGPYRVTFRLLVGPQQSFEQVRCFCHRFWSQLAFGVYRRRQIQRSIFDSLVQLLGHEALLEHLIEDVAASC